ncbi:helix-turn-helix domain-containing protein [Bacillus pinisoli]|uniref:helix-turn-helix domain-containing protein n=1 Tax=Bacillus pinisoli TaxID=2901866 RepID=UPI001FF64BBF|nr:helix-turn-helix domain-containing protein [Bacillus pinisoli]
MVKLLIADRDLNERTGINWLVNSYAIPFTSVLLSGALSEVVQLIESEVPEVVCIELDMIEPQQWAYVKELVNRYRIKVVAMTAEATFERAYEAIQLKAVDLWVKPLSPDTIKRVLSSCSTSSSGRIDTDTALQNKRPTLSYHSIFHSQESSIGDYQLMLIQLENGKKQNSLQSFISDYPFVNQPVILPLSDMIVCIFSFTKKQSKSMLTNIGNQFLREWEKAYSDSLSLVIYDSDQAGLSLHEKYLHARQALEIRFYQGTRRLFYLNHKVNWLIKEPFLTPADQRLWVDMLHGEKRDQIKDWMYHEFLIKQEPYPEPGLLRIRLTSILAQVSRFMKSHGLVENSITTKYHNVFDIILYSPILYRIVQEFLLFIYDVLDLAVKNAHSSRIDIIEQALHFMENHFSNQDLKLEDVAAHVERSPAYLSTLFTKRQGSSFRETLTAFRIKEAKRLLIETKLSIKDVAGKTGFYSANYFSRIFKEKTGLPPRNYRNQKKLL